MIPWRRKWQPTPGFLPGKCHGQRSLVGSVQGVAKESDLATKQQSLMHIQCWLHLHYLSLRTPYTITDWGALCPVKALQRHQKAVCSASYPSRFLVKTV